MFRGLWAVYFKRRRVNTGTTEREEAKKFLTNFVADLKNPQVSKKVELVVDVLEAYVANRAAQSKLGAVRKRWSHKQFIRLFGDRDAASLSEDDFVGYSSKRLAGGVTNTTVRTELMALRTALGWRLGKDKITKVKMPRKPEAQDLCLTSYEAYRLIECCKRRHLKLFVILGLNTLQRFPAILSLTWDRVYFLERYIDFRIPGEPTTHKRMFRIPIDDELLAVLSEAKKIAATDYVIEYGGGQVASVKHGLTDAAARAGLKEVSVYGLRRATGNIMLQRRVPI